MQMKQFVSDYLRFDFNFEIEEITCQGLYVKYDGTHAVVGGYAPNALARAYMLLAKGIREGKTSFEISQSPRFSDCGVMVDVSRGRVLSVAGVKKYLDCMALHGMNMMMLYTEDTYEVEGYPYMGYQRGRYSIKELQELDDYAASLGIELIPCIQTLGHMEKFLRYGVNKHLRESDRILLPGSEPTYEFIEACISSVRKAFRTKRIHIGCDEAHGLGHGTLFKQNGKLLDPFDIFNKHVHRVVDICKKYDFHPMMWSDMYFSIAAPLGSGDFGLNVEVPQYVIDAMPDVDMVFWDYYKTNNEFYGTNIRKHQAFGHKTVFAGGIWTWNGFVPNFRWTYDTAKPALEECLRHGVDFVMGTSWVNGGAEVSHLLATPCLSIYSEHCWLGESCTDEDIRSVAEFITKVPFAVTEAVSDFFLRLSGDYCTGQKIIWSDPLINLLCYDYDFPAIESLYTDALETLEKFPEVPDVDYYKKVFRCALHKIRHHKTVRDRYKAGDKAWLADYCANVIPVMLKDFEDLYHTHYTLWHRDYKTQGYEMNMIRFAGALERIRYTRTMIEQYVAGEIDEIEALEPELIKGKAQRNINRDRVMQSF